MRRAQHGHQRHPGRGSAVLYVVLLSPVLVLTLALAVDVGGLQLKKQRIRSAVDEAVVAAASVGATTGAVASLDPVVAMAAVRQAITDNLTPLQDQLQGTTADAIAASAEVRLITAVPAPDPRNPAVLLTQPTVEALIRVPVSTGLLAVAGVPPTITFDLTSSAALRLAGAG